MPSVLPKMEMGRSTEKSSIDPASHHPENVVTISGMGGHNVPEWVVTIQRNRWTVCSGMSGHNAAEYAIASIVESTSPVPENDFLRKDYNYLFERFFYLLEDNGPEQNGIIVFDELDKTRSKILIRQMESYFQKTVDGRSRSSQIIPEPFFVHSDLTSLIQIADLAAYVISWGFRIDRMTHARRDELAEFADQIASLRYKTTRNVNGHEDFLIWSFAYINDLRCRQDRKEEC